MTYDSISPFLIATAMLVGLNSCSKQQEQESTATQTSAYCLDAAFKNRITLVHPSYQRVAEAIHLTGSVEASPDRVVSFVSLVSGVITNVNFSIGDKVQMGQVLAEMQSSELSALQYEITGLKARIEVAENRLKAAKALFQDGISSQKELLEAQSEVQVLQAELTKNNENLKLYGAQIEKGVFQIKAPASGVITSKNLAPGAQISPETGALFTVSDLSQIWILANIYATHVQKIVVGMEVGITTLSYPDENFKGKISTISSVMDEEAKVLKARIELPNTDMRLKPGMLVDIQAYQPSDQSALSVPTSSVVFDDNQNYVVVYRDDCDLSIQKVEVLTQSNGTTFLSEGPDTTARVVGKNQLLLFEQLKNFQN